MVRNPQISNKSSRFSVLPVLQCFEVHPGLLRESLCGFTN